MKRAENLTLNSACRPSSAHAPQGGAKPTHNCSGAQYATVHFYALGPSAPKGMRTTPSCGFGRGTLL
jgi:hypothetical protein